MTFNAALSGLRAASTDLQVTGNNIANASTIGFKESRVEFGDVYASTVLGAGANQSGGGSRVQDIAQQFGQGNISFTSNELDLAISGGGFFVLSQDGAPVYSRAGLFSIDKDGFMVNNTGARVQGFAADDLGNIAGVTTDIVIETGNQSPRATTIVESDLNLDSTESILRREGSTLVTDGVAVADAQVGRQIATLTSLSTSPFSLTTPLDIATDPINFDISITGASGNNGQVSIDLSTAAGAPSTISNFNDLRVLVGIINTQIFSPSAPQTAIDVIAEAVDNQDGTFSINFNALQDGEASTIRILDGTTFPLTNTYQIGLPGANITAGSAANPLTFPFTTNGAAGVDDIIFDVVYDDGGVVTTTTVTLNGGSTITSMADLAAVIDGSFATSAVSVPVPAGFTITGDAATGTLQFDYSGSNAATVTINNVASIGLGDFDQLGISALPKTLDAASGAVSPITGVAAVSNGYPSQEITVVDPDGGETVYTSTLEASASQTASELNAIVGVSASATTTATIAADTYQNASSSMTINLKGVELISNTLADLADEINGLTSTTLPGVTAALETNGDLTITSVVGDDLNFSITSTDGGDSIEVFGNALTTRTFLTADGGTASGDANSFLLAGVTDTFDLTLLPGPDNTNPGGVDIPIDLSGAASASVADIQTELDADIAAAAVAGYTAGDIVVNADSQGGIYFTVADPDLWDRIRISNITPANDTLGFADLEDVTFNMRNFATEVIVGGEIEIVLDEGYSLANPNPPASGLFTQAAISNAEEFIINDFDPNDQATYNHSTSLNVFDSHGDAHVMTQYFVKQKFDPEDPEFNEPNVWTMYVLIDGQDVGDPDTSLPPPQNSEATRAAYTLRFNQDGTFNEVSSSTLLVSNWTPTDEDGNPNGALGPLNVLEGGTTPVAEPPSSSNFVIDMSNSTQFGSDFSINDVDQNGFTTGLLTGLNIASDGTIFARYTNGEAQAISQIALANFENIQGLQPLGDSVWAENFESGEPNIGFPGTAALGVIESGSLEESNVDLSEQLVNLIIAQRNFQASAKTIETANSITQTVINLR